ncbi:MAG: Cj0069 family protein, partial [Dehalococcoidia bacterium]|nr:Cj0069 family protein [Dehalococcoidia bacterium]
VSTHPGVIEKMGTKEVLVRTSGLECGTPTLLYRTLDEMRALLPGSLGSGPRVIKRDRGSGGNAVWKVELEPGAAPSLDAPVAVLHAGRGSQVERMTLREFVSRSAALFEAGSTVVDQPFQARIAEGMTRAYMVHDKVAGFGHQLVTALTAAPDSDVTPPPPPRYYFGPDQPEFQELKAKLETAWIAGIQQACGVPSGDLPAVWDADFLLGPPDAAGRDTYVLCEINVMGVFPIPEETLEPLAAAVANTLAGRHPRG